jgi:hypothetical protein
VTADEVWALWRRLAGAFGPWRTLRAALTTRAAFGFYGVDLASNLRRLPMTRLAAETLKDAPPPALDALMEIAEVNAQRNDAMWRMAVIFYVSVPLTLFLAAMDGLPDFGERILRQSVIGFWVWVGVLTAFVLYYFLTQWRARQIVAALKLLVIERQIGQGQAKG